MKLREDQEKVRTLLCDTVTLLRKNGLAFEKELRVEGLLGITLDQSEVFIVHINEKLNSDDLNGVIKDGVPLQRTRKRSHTDNDMDEASPAKRTNHYIEISPQPGFDGKADLYDTYNNNVAESLTKGDKLVGDAGEERASMIEDDRNAMRFCYNLDEEEASKENRSRAVHRKSNHTRKVIRSPVKQTDLSPAGSSTDCIEGQMDDLPPPDPSMGGPFITGIVNAVERQPVEPEEEDEKPWSELPQLGTLVPNGGAGSSMVAENGVWSVSPPPVNNTKGRRKQSADSVNIKTPNPTSQVKRVIFRVLFIFYFLLFYMSKLTCLLFHGGGTAIHECLCLARYHSHVIALMPLTK